MAKQPNTIPLKVKGTFQPNRLFKWHITAKQKKQIRKRNIHKQNVLQNAAQATTRTVREQAQKHEDAAGQTVAASALAVQTAPKVYRLSRAVGNTTLRSIAGVPQKLRRTKRRFVLAKNGVQSLVRAVQRRDFSHVTGSLKQGTQTAAKTVTRKVGNLAKGAATASARAARAGARRGVHSVEDKLTQSGDVGLQALGTGMKAARYTANTIKYAPRIAKAGVRAAKTAVTAPVKTVRTVKTAAKATRAAAAYARKHGAKAAGQKATQQAAKVAAKAAQAAGKAAARLAGKVALNFVVPVLGFLLLAVIFVSLMGAPVAVIGAFFGGGFSQKNADGTFSDMDTQQFVEQNVQDVRTDFAAKIADDAVAIFAANATLSGSRVMVLQVYVNGGMTGQRAYNPNVPLTQADITSLLDTALFTKEDIAKLVTPIFHSLVLTKYDLTPTEAGAKALLTECWTALANYAVTDEPLIYCDGSEGCLRRYQRAIMTTNEKGEPVIDHFEWYCGGHVTKAIRVSTAGVDALRTKYFTKPIADLTAKNPRTEAEEQTLADLKDNLEMLDEMAAVFEEEYGRA